jgi:hypothetical protein
MNQKLQWEHDNMDRIVLLERVKMDCKNKLAHMDMD